MGARHFRDLTAWQLARELRGALRPFWQRAAAARDFDLGDQLRNAARSTTSNIAEGFPCSHDEFARFLEIASRSLEEIEDRVIEMRDEALVTEDEARSAVILKVRTSRAIARLRDYLLSTPDPPSYKAGRRKKHTRRT
jgi:four helix bundle protein